MNELKELELRIESVIRKIEECCYKKRQVFIGIDGMAASGKTTMALKLAEIFDANVIHMDDFFLPQELRTEKRLQEIGGNIHYERFYEEVVLGFARGCPFKYRIFSCSQMDYTGSRVIEDRPLNIIEGAYSLHPRIIDLYDLKVFSQVAADEQMKRIKKRNGQLAEKFSKLWIPMENKYFQHFHIRELCDLIV